MLNQYALCMLHEASFSIFNKVTIGRVSVNYNDVSEYSRQHIEKMMGELSGRRLEIHIHEM